MKSIEIRIMMVYYWVIEYTLEKKALNSSAHRLTSTPWEKPGVCGFLSMASFGLRASGRVKLPRCMHKVTAHVCRICHHLPPGAFKKGALKRHTLLKCQKRITLGVAARSPFSDLFLVGRVHQPWGQHHLQEKLFLKGGIDMSAGMWKRDRPFYQGIKLGHWVGHQRREAVSHP